MMIKKKDEGFWSRKNIMSLIIVFLMISSVLAIWQGSQDSNALPSYNDHDVSLDDTRTYRIESDYGDIYGYSYPTALESIALDPSFVQYLSSSSSIVVLFDPTDPLLPYVEVLRKELALEDLPLLSKTISFGLIKENERYPYPVISCPTTIEPTLYLHTDNTTTTRIYQDSGCVVLEAQTWEELAYLKDRVVYTLAGIME